MKIHEYNEMMSYLTRPGMKTGGTIGGGTIQGQNMGYRTGFARPTKWNPNIYSQLYDEYVELVDKGFREENLLDVPKWETFVKNKTGVRSEILKNSASRVPDKPWPSKLIQNTKLKLAEKIIDAENK